MSADTRIGVVIPVFNRPKTLCETLGFVLRQSKLPQKLVIVDDGSTDDTADAAKHWLAAQNCAFEWQVIRKDHGTAAAARNRGLEEIVNFPYVAFLDSDDHWPADFLQRTSTLLHSSPEAVAVSTDRVHCEEKGVCWHIDSSGIEPDPTRWLFDNDGGIASCTLFRAKAIELAGGWREELETGEDFTLFIDLAQLGQWLYAPGSPVEFHREKTQRHGEEINLSKMKVSMERDWAILYEQAYASLGVLPEHQRFALERAVAKKWRFAGTKFLKSKRLDEAIDAYAAARCWDGTDWPNRIRLAQCKLMRLGQGSPRRKLRARLLAAENPNIRKIFYINLDKDSTRKQLLELRLRKFLPEIPFQRFPGVPQDSVERYNAFIEGRLPKHLAPIDGRYPFPGAIACVLAHYEALKQIREFRERDKLEPGNGEPAYLVLEDDCVFDNSVFPLITKAMNSHLPDDWQIAKHSRGERNVCDRINDKFFDTSGSRFRSWPYYYGTHFMVYRASAIDAVIERLETRRLDHFDVWIRDNIDGVYSFADRLHIKQSNLQGSNTNPEIFGIEHEDYTSRFGLANLIPQLLRRIHIRAKKLNRALRN